MRSVFGARAAIESREHETTEDDGARPQVDWKGVYLGVGVTCLTLVGLTAVGALLMWSGMLSDLIRANGGRLIAVYAVLALTVALAFGSWFGIHRKPSTAPVRVGLIIAGIVLLTIISVAAPFVARIADFRSVAIALGVIDAPNVGTRPTEALHHLTTTGGETSSISEGGAVSIAWDHVRKTIAYLAGSSIAVLVAAILGAVLGSLSGTSTPRVRPVTRIGAASGLVSVISGVAVLTVVLWSSIWPVYVALADFDQSGGPEVGVSLSEVARHPSAMWGETVTISAQVDQLLNPHALLIGNNKPLVGDKLLVVSKSELQDLVLVGKGPGAAISDSKVIQVSGVVRPYESGNLESSLGSTLDPGALSGYGSNAMLVAESIDVDKPIASEAGDKEFGAGSAGYDLGVTVDDILAQPQELVGLTVTVSDEVEEHLLTPHAFLLGDSALLAVSTTAHPELFVEATAYVTGEVRIFNYEEAERTTGLDLDERLRDYEGQPMILVESLTMVT
ncbi:MAG TPA: hypothetical protein VGR08_00510 [Thermomicrobiales bacterium]|nr:hypothetical protein [Thermomicrobiales bacterium]